jgi:hypothetical protein
MAVAGRSAGARSGRRAAPGFGSGRLGRILALACGTARQRTRAGLGRRGRVGAAERGARARPRRGPGGAGAGHRRQPTGSGRFVRAPLSPSAAICLGVSPNSGRSSCCSGAVLGSGCSSRWGANHSYCSASRLVVAKYSASPSDHSAVGPKVFQFCSREARCRKGASRARCTTTGRAVDVLLLCAPGAECSLRKAALMVAGSDWERLQGGERLAHLLGPTAET